MTLQLHFILKISADLFGSLALTFSARLSFQHVSEFWLRTDTSVAHFVMLHVLLQSMLCDATLIDVTFWGVYVVLSIGGHRHRSQCRRYPTSDIDICYSDIGDKYVRLENVIPILEVFRYRHQSSFRYLILKKKDISSCKFEPKSLGKVSKRYNTKLLCLSV
jgi:hypothetical protein